MIATYSTPSVCSVEHLVLILTTGLHYMLLHGRLQNSAVQNTFSRDDMLDRGYEKCLRG
jgi:hypothetical protein